jgi:hypothetical protein
MRYHCPTKNKYLCVRISNGREIATEDIIKFCPPRDEETSGSDSTSQPLQLADVKSARLLAANLCLETALTAVWGFEQDIQDVV